MNKTRTINRATNTRRTLFVSGLKSDVRTNQLYNYFTGSTKITLKRCRATPHLMYLIDVNWFLVEQVFFVSAGTPSLSTVHLEKLSAIYSDPLIMVFLVQNVTLNMPTMIQFPLFNITTTIEKQLWLVEYQRISVRTIYIVYSSVVVQ